MTIMMIIIYKITLCLGYVKLIQTGAIFYHLMAFKKKQVSLMTNCVSYYGLSPSISESEKGVSIS